MTKKLKTCPFCNGEVTLTNRPWLNGDDGFEIDHVDWKWAADHRCPIAMACYDTEDDAIEAWNTRHKRTCKAICEQVFAEHVWRCSACGEAFDSIVSIYNFCPHCGAEVVDD